MQGQSFLHRFILSRQQQTVSPPLLRDVLLANLLQVPDHLTWSNLTRKETDSQALVQVDVQDSKESQGGLLKPDRVQEFWTVRTSPDSWSAVKKIWQLKEGEKEARREEKVKGTGKEQDRQPRLKLLSAAKRVESKKKKKAKKAKSKDEKSLHPQWAHQLPPTRTLDLSHPEKQKEQWKQREWKEELGKDGVLEDGRVGKGQNVNRRKGEEKRNE
uniref:Uncharacterized protein n=1 Tax=Chromera velia CCMP2878 TaxID=1169474 RepID=A0A0G4G6C1_9ALVE|eukprot:Cvel_20374.t1-p1 / transcript=Cvel_20374.t1 / gene=Cvel_20374 / organism=Chromera_velia_CCMP2878 / gene_product=hypothetical protein / transcript_product=hypothetical protein / location=Cvel_scaffold1823:6023-12650(-) / protein_length=214 / sequence_SO=supercontig / SO=protein_coding / is_pseudo=false